MANPYPAPNETTDSSFIDLYKTLRFQLLGRGTAEGGEIEPKEMLVKADSDDPGLRVFGLAATFTLLDRQVAVSRWEFPTGHFVYLSYRELRPNSDDPYAKPFKHFPLQFLTSYRQLTEGSTADLDRIADAAAAVDGFRPCQYFAD